jgi:DNA-binding NarL/FixJ family response regulator
LITSVLSRLRGEIGGGDTGYSLLSPQERRVLDQVACGLTNRQIASRLHLSEKTVKNYVSSLLHKLGFERRTEAAVYAAKRSAKN